jgi:mRNA interferase MazF
MKRGEIWLADLNPTRGSEQAGIRPVLIFQNDAINVVSATVLVIPFTTNLRRAALPTCVQLPKGEGGLASDSVLLCHHLRSLDKTRLHRKLGTVTDATLGVIESCVLFTMGIL